MWKLKFNLKPYLSTAALPGQTTKTALTEDFMFQNVAYRPTVYITGVNTIPISRGRLCPPKYCLPPRIQKPIYTFALSILVGARKNHREDPYKKWKSKRGIQILDFWTNSGNSSHSGVVGKYIPLAGTSNCTANLCFVSQFQWKPAFGFFLFFKIKYVIIPA